MQLPKGSTLQEGKYTILSTLGQGGFGITYKASMLTEIGGALGKKRISVEVAIKEFFFKDYCTRESDSCLVTISFTTGRMMFQRFREKLIKEAHILSSFHHPHIIKVFDVFQENDTAYIVMEFIEGESLQTILDKKKNLSENSSIRYIRDILSALKEIHGRRILHLDIKPSNILIDKEDKAILIDFGISKRYGEQQLETSTTPASYSKGYAPYEQYLAEGIKYFTPATDLYALGATLYRCLTGEVPMESLARLEQEMPLPSELDKQIGKKAERAILKAMNIRKDDRFQTADELMNALQDDKGFDEQVQEIKLVKEEKPVILSDWEKTLREDTIDAYREYISTYPGSQHNPHARKKIVEFEDLQRQKIESEKISQVHSTKGYDGKTEPITHVANSVHIKEPDKPIKEKSGISDRPWNLTWIWWVLGIIAIEIIAISIVQNCSGPSKKDREEKRIADSIRVADSLAMVQAEQQRIADSIAMAQAIELKSAGPKRVKSKNGNYGYMDADGNIVIDFKYSDANDFQCGLAYVYNGTMGWHFIDVNGKYKFKAFNGYGVFYGGGFVGDMLLVRKEDSDNSLFGYVNKTGQLSIPCQFDDAAFFDLHGRARVKKGGRWHSIDMDGNYVME